MPCDHQDILRDAASRWYAQHLGAHLHRDRALAAQRCASHLITEWHAEPGRARDLSLQVLGSVESRSSGACIDMDRTTSHALFLVDPATGWRVMLTAADLVRMARMVDNAGRVAPPVTGGRGPLAAVAH